MCRDLYRPHSLFQYNHCFGGIYRRKEKTTKGRRFNTTIVSVEFHLVFPAHQCFYNVSIQPLFRWNRAKAESLAFIKESFNTTIVSVELNFSATDLTISSRFQYNHCFGGIFDAFVRGIIEQMFQYNHCFGGIVILIKRDF